MNEALIPAGEIDLYMNWIPDETLGGIWNHLR